MDHTSSMNQPEGLPLSSHESTLAPGTENCPWYVLHTRSRHEKRLAEKCGAMGVPFYLPLGIRSRRYRGKVHEHEAPLFPGYLFCRFPFEKRSDILSTRHVARIIKVPDQEKLLDDLIQINKAQISNAFLEPYDYIKRGVRVRIVSGPFKDIEGIVSNRRNKCRVILGIKFIGRATSLEVGIEMIEPV